MDLAVIYPPSVILTSAQMVTTQTTVAANAQAETIAADETETFSMQCAWEASLLGRNPLKHESTIIPCSPNILLSHPNLQPHRKAFEDSQLHISKNALCSFEGDSETRPGWVNGYTKPLHYIAQINGLYVLIDTEEAAHVVKNPDSVRMLWLVGPGPLIANGGWTASEAFKKMEDQAKLISK